MITLTFPDGAAREYPAGITGTELVNSIAKSLAKKTVAMSLDGELTDLADQIEKDAQLEFVAREDAKALELIRHDAAHVLAEAVQSLFPGTQATIGPVIDSGFYYDFHREAPFTLEDLAKIEKKMTEIIAKNAPFTKEVWSREDAKAHFAAKGETFKVELVDAIPDDQSVKIYKQGEWLDLCRGPHMTSVGKIGPAFKLTKVAGAYWRGDASKPMLSRIYGTAFADKAALDQYLEMLEEAEKRDHRRLGNEMDLFHFQPEAPGSVFWHSKGWALFQQLITYMRRRQDKANYQEVNSPDMMDRALWEASGHWEKYQENMFVTETEDERVFALKPMNCPGHVQIFKNGLKSYRDLPIKLSEFGKVHRYEPSGALHGLMRVRSFTQDDAHIFITDDQITEECLTVNALILSIYADFGFEDVIINFSTRPEQRVGSDEIWDKAESALEHAIQVAGKEYTLNPGDGAFYGPKLDYVLRDAIGREWQCGTLQVDLNLPGRLGAFYIDNTSDKQVPVMLHRALFGSLERFTGILIEHHAGRLPLWLSPTQVVVCSITSDQDDFAEEVREAFAAAGLRVTMDLRNEKISYKVREHSHAKVPVIIAVGRREAEERTVAVRRLGSDKQAFLSLSDAITEICAEAEAPDIQREKLSKAAE